MRKYFFTILLTLLGHFSFAQPLLQMINTLSTPEQKADTLKKMAQRYHMRGKPDSAEYLYNLGLSYAHQVKDNNLQVIQLYCLLSKISQLKRQPDKALEIVRKAKPYITASTPKEAIENYLSYTSDYFHLLLQYDSAMYYLQETEKLNNSYRPYSNWYVYEGMAEIFMAYNNFSKAEEYYLKSYELTKKRGIRMHHGVMINHVANFYRIQNNTEKFAYYLQEHEEFLRSGKKDFRKDPVHSLLFIDWGNTALSKKVEFLQAVKQEHVRNGLLHAASLTNYHIAAIYDEADKPEEALKYLYENRDFFIKKTVLADSYQNLKYIYKLQVKTGQSSEALFTANQLFDLSAKLTDMNNQNALLELEQKYETEKKEREIILLNAENKLNTIELLRAAELSQSLERENLLIDSSLHKQMLLAAASDRENKLRMSELEKEKQLSISLARENELKQAFLKNSKKKNLLLTAGICLLGLAGFVILYQYRRQIRKNQIIKKQHADLEMLNREIHHRVKNNLQVISSLLDLQSEATGDPLTAEKFQEGSQRVQSMAFIHQNLYQGESIDSINVKDYIQMLTQSLMQSYSTDDKRIKLITNVEMLKLHSDTVIPIGMIINELVSNALKYAFKNGKEGEIEVALRKIDDKLLLRVRDNGVGMPAAVDTNNLNSFGYKIIHAFSKKLKGILTINNQQGTDVQVLFSKFKTT